METNTALIGTDSTVELYTITDVGLNITFIVNPGHTESEDTVRLNYSFNDLCLLEFRMLIVNLFD